MSIGSLDVLTQQIMNHVNRRMISVAGDEKAEGEDFLKTLQSVQTQAVPAPVEAKTGKTLDDYRVHPVTVSPTNRKTFKIVSKEPSTAPLSAKLSVTSLPGTAVETVSKEFELPKGASAERQRIEKAIVRASGQYDVPANLIRAVIQAESGFRVKAVSKAGAKGLMQLMPGTARELGVKDSFNIEQNIDGGTKYLRRMLDLFGGDSKTALAAYNAGPGTIIRSGGRVPYRETVAYVDRVMSYQSQLEVV